MFSKEESKHLRQEFWIAFGKSFPRKWILHNTKTKGLFLKFHFDVKKAIVSLDVEHDNLEYRVALWEKLVSLKSIFITDFLKDAKFEDSYILDNTKEISRVYVEKLAVSIHNKNTWQETMKFFNESMHLLETFFEEYKDFIEV